MGKITNHASRAHALLNASGSSRWLNCTPSARLEDAYGEHQTTVYAQEGTLAHEFCELFLRHDVLCTINDAEFDNRLEELMSNELFTDDMLEAVSVYTDYCTTQYESAKTISKSATIEVEQKLDLTQFVPESFGTCDCAIINEPILEIIDYKHGRGVPVYAQYNKQGMLYAIGALMKYDMCFNIDTVRITICQPRIDNISSWEISVTELLEWANNTLKPLAEMAFNGEGDLNPGDWCKFCSVKTRCKALYEQQLEVAKYEFSTPELLTDEEIADVLKRAPMFTEWINSVTEYAQKRAIEQKKIWPGFKLVEGISRRKWLDEDKAAEAIFERFPEVSDEQVFATKLRCISDIEKLVGKKRFAQEMADIVIKPQGKPTLVPETDKRPAMGIEDAINDFK